jgi:pyruvate dehydrogenase E1 component beta subunit
MSKKSWWYAQFEGIVQAMGDSKDLIFAGDPGIATFPGRPEINLMKKYGPDRVIDYTSIDEVWYTNVVLGSALVGQRAVYYNRQYMANTYPFHFVSQHAGKLHLMTGGQATVPAVFWNRISSQGPGMAGQHSDYECDSWYMHVPGVRTVIPATVYDAKGLMLKAVKSDDPVVYLDYAGFSNLVDDVPDDAFEVPFGKAAIRMQGTDLTIVSSGGGMPAALKGAEMLKKDGMSVEVIDLRTLNPMDTETLVKSVQKTRRLLTVDQSKYTLCPGAEVIARVAEGVTGVKVKRIAFPDVVPAGAPEMFLWAKPNENHVFEAGKMLV